MKNKDTNKVFLLIVCIFATVVGIYMTFFYNGSNKEAPRSEKTQQNIEGEQSKDNKTEKEDGKKNMYEATELPDTENESSNETYSEGITVNIYFTNTAVLDKGNLPSEVQAELAKDTQKYLFRSGYEDVTELYVEEESYEETEKNISFNCFMDGHEERLQILYDREKSVLEFGILD